LTCINAEVPATVSISGQHTTEEDPMPQDAVIVVSAVALAFIVFMLVLAYAQRATAGRGQN
jgi:hypothetical protein